jgi:hypothetical protein
MRRALSSGKSGSWRIAGTLALALAAAVPLSATPLHAETEFDASYAVTLAGITIGRADAKSRFTRTGYAAVIAGTTSGVSRLISDARASLVGVGRFSPRGIAPASFSLDTVETGLETHVRMAFQNGAITELTATPKLPEAPDRVPLNTGHLQGVVDPVGAFLIATGGPGLPDGQQVCAHRLQLFDGWQRYDVGLAYKETREASGTADTYSGKIVVCAARYIPVAGHRREREAVKFMAENKRIEVWYVPIGQLPLLAPYRILIGTKFGDLVIASTRFVVSETKPAIGN